jgi:hypothetical protein
MKIEGNYDLKKKDLSILIDNKNKCKSLKIKPLENFYDVCIFNSITSLDLDVTIDGYLNSKHEWQKKFYIRSISLILNEHLDKIHALMSSHFYNFILSSQIFNSIKDEILSYRTTYRELNRKKQSLSKIRNEVIAHRSKDAEQFIESLDNINVNDLFNLAIETQTLLNQFTQLTDKILEQIIINFDQFYKEMKSK